MTRSRQSDTDRRWNRYCDVDPWVKHWMRVWEGAYAEHHPIVALYALARGSARVLRLDLWVLGPRR